MALRKYLQGGTILAIAQRRFDRVLDVEVKGHEGHTYLLSAELMGRHSNMILIRSGRAYPARRQAGLLTHQPRA